MNKKYLCLLAIIILTDNNAYACRGRGLEQRILAWMNNSEVPSEEEIEQQKQQDEAMMMRSLDIVEEQTWEEARKTLGIIGISVGIHEQPDIENGLQEEHPEIENARQEGRFEVPHEEDIEQQKQHVKAEMKQKLNIIPGDQFNS